VCCGSQKIEEDQRTTPGPRGGAGKALAGRRGSEWGGQLSRKQPRMGWGKVTGQNHLLGRAVGSENRRDMRKREVRA